MKSILFNEREVIGPEEHLLEEQNVMNTHHRKVHSFISILGVRQTGRQNIQLALPADIVARAKRIVRVIKGRKH